MNFNAFRQTEEPVTDTERPRVLANPRDAQPVPEPSPARKQIIDLLSLPPPRSITHPGVADTKKRRAVY